MPVTRRTSTTHTRRTSTSTSSTSSASTSATRATATRSTRAADEPSAPRGAGAGGAHKPVDVKINGFGGKSVPSVNISLVPQPGQVGRGESRSEAGDGGWVTRGYIDVKYKPAVGGVDIEVETRQKKPTDMASYKGDAMVLYLQARVLDGGKERIITLGTLFDGVMNPDKKSTTTRTFHVDYDDINKYLKKHSPHLQFAPGDPLAAYAVWKNVGHQWGGFMREGYFQAPQPLGRRSVVDVRVGGATGAGKNEAVRPSDVPKPIDITHKLPEKIVKDFPLVLEKGGKFVSRREHETKFCPKSMDELKAVTLKLMKVAAGAEKEREKFLIDMFGKDAALSKQAGHPVSGWKISTTDRYYAKDAHGKVMTGKDGLPLVVPMFDVYQDDSKGTGVSRFPFAQQNMAVRFRDGEIKAGENVGSMGKLNMKTPRVSDPFSLIQTGLELSLDTKPGITKSDAAMKQLAEYLDKAPAPYNPLLEQKKVSYSLRGNNALASAVNNLANRYKFTLEHESGLEIEVSMDFVHAGFMFETKQVAATKSMSDAEKFNHYAKLLKKPDADTVCISGPLKEKRGEINTVVFENSKNELVMACFWVDQDGKKHATEHPAVRFPQVEMELDHVQARTTGPVQGAYTTPSEVKNITNDNDQEKFLKDVSAKATMNGPPTSHAWEDLKEAKLYETSDYAALVDAVGKFRAELFPKGVEPARQKAAQALELGKYIEKKKVTLTASLPSVTGRDIYVQTDYQDRTKIKVSGHKMGKAGTVTIDWDGFPIKIPVKGTATAKDVAKAIEKKLDEAILHKATVTESNGTYTVAVSER